jgi:hypothetical protein
MTELEQHHVRVFLRLRPLNRLEVNRRSRSVVEILDDQRVTVEDPAEGDREVTCDRVSTKQFVPCESCCMYGCRNSSHSICNSCLNMTQI